MKSPGRKAQIQAFGSADKARAFADFYSSVPVSGSGSILVTVVEDLPSGVRSVRRCLCPDRNAANRMAAVL